MIGADERGPTQDLAGPYCVFSPLHTYTILLNPNDY